MEECKFYTDRESKLRSYEQEIQMEKERECQKALEREKIATGMRCTREDEIRLREMQRLQVEERRKIEEREGRFEWMWHQVLLDEVHRKEQAEIMENEKRKQDMLERRRAYDEQIASANRKRQDAIREERDRENRRLEEMRQKMEADHYEEIRRKKEQQITNKKNYVEGHELKLLRIHSEKKRDRQIDNQTISVALENLKRERQRKRYDMQKWQREEQIFVENFNREREIASVLDMDAEQVTSELKHQEEIKADEKRRQMEEERRRERDKAAEEYKRYIRDKNEEIERQKRERLEKMARVNRTAYNELRKNLEGANEELNKQLEYRHRLNNQIKMNQEVRENQLQDIEAKQRAFSKKPIMFKEAMDLTFAKSPGRKSTNPKHPFRRIIENHDSSSAVHLPLI